MTVIAITLTLLAPAARAQKVANPGSGFTLASVRWTLSIGANTFFDVSQSRSPQCSDGLNNDPDLAGGAPQDSTVDYPADAQCTSSGDDSEVQSGFQPLVPVSLVNGSITASGSATWPAAGIVLPQSWVFVRFPIHGAYVVTMSPTATHDSSGTIDPLSGTTSLRLRMQIDLDAAPLGSNCRIASSGSPIDINTYVTATPYDPAAGTLTVSNQIFSVPGAQGCSTFPINMNDELNHALGLPSPSGNNESLFEAIFDPVSNRPLPAIAPSLAVTPNVACRPVTFDGSASTSVRPVASNQFDFTNDGTFDQTGVTQTSQATFSTPGTRTARLRVTDADGDFDEVTSSYSVGTNLPPTAAFSPDPLPTVPPGGSQTITFAGTDPEGGTVSFSISSGPSHGTLSGSGTSRTYTPTAGYTGPDSFTFAADDDCGNSTPKTVAITVGSIPMLSVAVVEDRDPVPQYGVVTYTTTVTNTGSVSLTSTALSQTLTGLTMMSVAPSQGSCTMGGGSVSCAVGTVGVGSSATVTVRGVATSTGTVSTTSQATSGSATASDSETTTVNGVACTLIGTQGPDTIPGTSGNDVICGLGGNDTIAGGGGSDILIGQGGNDSLVGDAGNDSLLGGDGTDQLNSMDGIAGNDLLAGGSGTDTCTRDGPSGGIAGDARVSCP